MGGEEERQRIGFFCREGSVGESEGESGTLVQREGDPLAKADDQSL